jgi:hypothetical protein
MSRRMGYQQMLGCSERLLDGPQLLVAQHGLERVQVGIGAQHEDAVEPLLFLDPFGVNCEMIFADRLEVAAVAGVADKSLVALRELTLQGGEVETRSAASFSAS